MYVWLTSLTVYSKDVTSRYEKIVMECWKHLKKLGLRGERWKPQGAQKLR